MRENHKAGAGLLQSRLNRVPMGPEDEPNSGGAPSPTPPPTPAPPPQPPTNAAPPNPAPTPRPFDDGKPVTISSREFKRFKDEAAAAAEKKALAKLAAQREQEAKDAGFPSHAAMVEAAKKFKNPPRAKPGDPAPAVDPKQIQTLTQQVESEKQARLRAQKQVKRLETELSQERAQSAIREELVRHGVQHVKFALGLVEEKMADLARGKKDDEVLAAMQAFDIGKFINEDLRGSHPYLFTVATVPANTGPGPNGSPPPPKPPAVTRDGAPGPVDTRKMSPQEFAKYRQNLPKRFGGNNPAA